MLTPISGTSAELLQNGRWVFEGFVGDDDGCAVDASPTVTAVLPDGSTAAPTVVSLGNGLFRASLPVTQAGRYVATASAGAWGSTAFSAWVEGITTNSGMPTLDEVRNYLGGSEEDVTPQPAIEDALAAEAAAQRRVCNVGAIYTADLRQALMRRVARNLSLRGIPLAVLRGDAESGSLVLPGKDPEVRRLEAPYRKLVQP